MICYVSYIINTIIFLISRPFRRFPRNSDTKFGQTAAKGAPWLMPVAMTTRYSEGRPHAVRKIDTNCQSVK